jgi:uncharacterized protein YcnI
VVAVGAALGAPATASADVVITPTHARQGDEADVTFRVTEDRPGVHTTQVEVQFPAATPIPEIYPLSDPYWAPKITYRELSHPVQGHHGSGSTTVASGITWFRAAPAAPSGVPAELRVAMGPMPEVDRLPLTVLQTYSDGQVRRWPSASGAQDEAGLVLLLTPAAAQPNAAAPRPSARSSDHWSLLQEHAPLGLALIAVLGLAIGLLTGLVGRLTRKRLRRPRPEEEGPLEPPDEDTPADLEATRPSI